MNKNNSQNNANIRPIYIEITHLIDYICDYRDHIHNKNNLLYDLLDDMIRILQKVTVFIVKDYGDMSYSRPHILLTPPCLDVFFNDVTRDLRRIGQNIGLISLKDARDIMIDPSYLTFYLKDAWTLLQRAIKLKEPHERT